MPVSRMHRRSPLITPSSAGLSSGSPSFAKTLVWVIILGYMGFLVARSTYQNYTTNKKIVQSKQQIAERERTNLNLKRALLYYNSTSFKEVQARQHLGLQGKDEKVVALPEMSTEAELTMNAMGTTVEEKIIETPYMAWWHLFFGADKDSKEEK